MSDRKKNAPDPITETDRQFLERTGVSSQIRDVLTKIIENRPNDPITFLADFFDTVGDKVNKVNKCHQQITLTHHSRPAFRNNLRISYDILSQHRVPKNQKGVNGGSYMELIAMLCINFPGPITEKLMKKIQVRDYEVVNYDVYQSGVFTCLVLQDFLKLTGDLFSCLDTTTSDKIERPLADAVLKQLNKSVGNDSGGNPSVLEAGYMLSPSIMHETISQALLQTGDNKKVMAKEEFQFLAADCFISQVKGFR